MLRVSLGSHRLANDVANPFRYAWVSVMDESRSHTCGTGNGCDGKLSVTSNEIVDDLVERGECLRPERIGESGPTACLVICRLLHFLNWRKAKAGNYI